ncbi:MAG: hypothetical protein NT031_15235 [Planctomycetota bacterium]|nr:hypothetical protein [Planctomycetota bacterium]
MILAAHIRILGVELWTGVVILAGLWGLAILIPQVFGRTDRGGDSAKGHAIWVEPLRWPGWAWGRYSVSRGLRKAGFEGTFEYYAWQTWWQGLLVLPVLRGRGLVERSAARLAEGIARRRAQAPEAPVYVLAYSAGGFVAVRAMELLPLDTKVRSLAICQAAMRANYDLSEAMLHVEAATVVTASAMDFVVLGAGTTLLSGSDGVRGPSMGWLGARHAALAGLPSERLCHIRWRAGDVVRRRLFGTHLWALDPRFIANVLAPAMGISGFSGERLL